MSIGYKKTPAGIIMALTVIAVLTLVIALVVLMQEPQSLQTLGKNDGGKVYQKREIVRLPEELTAEFQYRDGWWVANGPADDPNEKANEQTAKDQQRIFESSSSVGKRAGRAEWTSSPDAGPDRQRN